MSARALSLNPTPSLRDYARIERAIAFLIAHADRQPGLDEMAAHLSLSPYHFQRLFARWAGVTPKRFLQVLTVERAKALLAQGRPVLDVADAVGLSSGSRLYDHFLTLEAVTPGAYKNAGAGLDIAYGVHETPFGPAFVAMTPHGICRLSFIDGDAAARELAMLKSAWPGATLRADAANAGAALKTMFESARAAGPPSPLHLKGTNFQVSVWRALLRVGPGQLTTYSDIARALGQARAARAVGLAVGANPIAFFIPCHRVIRASGALGGYRWGERRKHAMHAWESA